MAVAVLVGGCDFNYRAAVPTVEDEVVVQTINGDKRGYDHPIRLAPAELAAILQEVHVEFPANWLQRLIAGPLETVPLFDEASLAQVVPPLVEALGKAGPNERIVFYIAQRRSDARRDVTSGALFVKDRLLHLVLANYQNRVDVVPGLPAYDRVNPELAVSPQRFALVFDHPEFAVKRELDLVDGVFGAAPPRLMVDYRRFLTERARAAALPGPSEPAASRFP